MMSPDEFHLHHAGEIREALIMIEGDSGAFELLAHGALPRKAADDRLYAIVRSTESGRVHLLARSPQTPEPAPHKAVRWRELAVAETPDLPAIARDLLRRGSSPDQ